MYRGVEGVIGWTASVLCRDEVDFISMLGEPVRFDGGDALDATRRVGAEETVGYFHL